MKFSDYELKCGVCDGIDFARRVNISEKKGDRKSVSLFFLCKACDAMRAYVLMREPNHLYVLRKGSVPRGMVKLGVGDMQDVRRAIRAGSHALLYSAKVFALRHGNYPDKFAESAGITTHTARRFLTQAEQRILEEDAKVDGLARVDLESHRRREAMKFYRSIVLDPGEWERNPKMVMQARRELSALEGIAGDTNQVNLNVGGTGPAQITVYQLAIPDDGRTRLPPKQIEIECQPVHQS